MKNISEADIEKITKITNILNNTGGIVKQNNLKQLTPTEQRTGVKMWNEILNFTNKQLEEITPILNPILKKYNETNKK